MSAPFVYSDVGANATCVEMPPSDYGAVPVGESFENVLRIGLGRRSVVVQGEFTWPPSRETVFHLDITP